MKKIIYIITPIAFVIIVGYLMIPSANIHYVNALPMAIKARQRAVIYELWDYYERHDEFPYNLHQIERYSTDGLGFHDSLSDRYYDWLYLYPGKLSESEYKSKIPVILMPTTFYDESYTKEEGMGDLKFIGYLNGEIEDYKASGGHLRYILNPNKQLEVSNVINIPYTKKEGQQADGL